MKWFAIRVFFCRELKLQKALKQIDIESFVPIKVVHKEKEGIRTSETVPAIHNLIFIHTTRSKLREIRRLFDESIPFQYMIDKGRKDLIVVPNDQMESFKKICSTQCDNLMFLDENIRKHCIPGQLVRVVDGPFKDVEGHIVRIKKDRRVVVCIKGVAAVATTFIDPSLLLKINE